MSDINAINFQVTQPSTTPARTESAGTNAFVKRANSDFQDLVRQIAREKAAAEKAAAAKERADAASGKAADKAADRKTQATAASEKTAANAAVDTDIENVAFIITDADADITTSSVAFDLSGSGETTTLDANGLKTLKAALDNLLHGLPADQKPVAIKLTGTQLQKIMQDLKANAGEIQNDEQSLIATGLSPEQLTKLSALIAQAANQTGTENQDVSEDDGLKAILVGILKLVSDEKTTEPQTIFLPKTLMVSKDEKPAKDKETQEDILAASMNAIIVGSEAPPPVPTGPMNTSGVKEGGIDSGAIAPEKKGGGFDDVLKMLEQLQNKSAGSDKAADALVGQKTANETAASASAGNSTTTGASFAGLFGSMSADGSLGGTFPDGMNWSQNNQYGLSNVQPSNPAQLTSLVTQASATAGHPATQVVAATLARTFEGGETKHLTLRLDPPELGKIEIQMQFTKDKSVKTHMIFEKPETMLMMQRDSRTLELAMQNAGMDAGGNTLSFELGSNSNNSFTNDQGGSGGSRAGRSAGGNEPQIIETTMSWSVDAETGMKHYNVLV